MKQFNFKSFGNKVAGITVTAAMITLVCVTACKKDSTASTSADVSEADMVELTTDAIATSTGGFDTQVNASVNINTVAVTKMSCGATKDTTIANSTPSTLTPNYAYSLSWAYTLNCTNSIPNNFVFTFTGTSSYNNTLMQSADKSTASLTLGGLQPTSAVYNLTASYERAGSQTSKVNSQKTFTSDLKFTASNITVTKTTYQIASGTAAITITGTSGTGSTFSFSGTLTFLGNKKATLLLNSGTTYNITWN